MIMPETRKHAAIMFTDIVGYTALMGSDEDRAFVVLKKNREIHSKFISKYNGTLIKEMGDGMLISFNLASEAVRCAVEIQRKCKENDIPLKIGIHESEMVFEGDDVLGDGVNIASRIQDSANTGFILISDTVYRDIKNKADIFTEYVGKRSFKNVDELIGLYKVSFDDKTKPNLSSSPAEQKSIAVLPFVNMSNDPEQEYFCEGVTEEIINALSHLNSLKVIARTSAFMFKGKHKDVRVIGKKLDVANILEGSVRKAANRIRITAQLVKVSDGSHLWSEKYDRDLEDIFSIQDDISLAIVDKLKIKLLIEDEDVIQTRHTKNLEAYNLYLRANYEAAQFTETGTQRALDYCQAAIRLDPKFSLAYSGIGILYLLHGMVGRIAPRQGIRKAKEFIKKAISLNNALGEAHAYLGNIYLMGEYNWIKADKHCKKGVELNPNSFATHNTYSIYLILSGQFNRGIAEAKIAQKLDPLNSLVGHQVCMNYIFSRQFNSAIESLNEFIAKFPSFYWAHALLGALMEYENDLSNAHKALEKSVELSNNDPVILSNYISFLYTYNRKKKADELFDSLNNLARDRYVAPHAFARVYLAQGKFDLAYEWLELAYKENDYFLLTFLASPFVRNALPDEPRFRHLFKKVGLKDCMGNFMAKQI